MYKIGKVLIVQGQDAIMKSVTNYVRCQNLHLTDMIINKIIINNNNNNKKKKRKEMYGIDLLANGYAEAGGKSLHLGNMPTFFSPKLQNTLWILSFQGIEFPKS